MRIWIWRVAAAVLCLQDTIIEVNANCDYSKVNLELVILQDATDTFRDFIDRGHEFYPKFLESLNVKSLKAGAAIFGAKPDPDHPSNRCFESLFIQTDDLKTDKPAFEAAVNQIKSMKQKWVVPNTDADSASGIVHITTSGHYFSKVTENDNIIRILIVVTGEYVSLGTNDLDPGALKNGIPCTLKDKDTYPSNKDVNDALNTSGVTILSFVDRSMWWGTYASWQSYLKDWGMLNDTVFGISAAGKPDDILQTLHDGFESKICQVLKDTPTTTTTTTTTAKPTSRPPCNYSGVNLELVILQEGSGTFSWFIENGHEFYPKFLKNLNVTSLTAGAAIFGDKPDPHNPSNRCFESIFYQTDDLKTNDTALGDAEKKIKSMSGKWYTYYHADSASGIVHITTSGHYFSRMTENDSTIRILLIVAETKPAVGSKDLGLDALKNGIPCTVKDKDYFPSNKDVKDALKTSGVTVLGFIDNRYYPGLEQDWSSYLKLWGMRNDTVFGIYRDANGDDIVKTLHNGFESKICQVLKDTPTTSTTKPTTTTTGSTSTPANSTATSAHKKAPFEPVAQSHSTQAVKIGAGVAGAVVGAVVFAGIGYYGARTLLSNNGPTYYDFDTDQDRPQEWVENDGGRGRRETIAELDEIYPL